MAELTELADPEQASCVNHRRRRDVSDCVCNPVDIAQIERQVTISRIGDGCGPAADPGDAPAVTQEAFNDRSANARAGARAA
jgi:hypothetical protein